MKYKTTRAWARRELDRMAGQLQGEGGRLAGVLGTHGNIGLARLDASLVGIGQAVDTAVALCAVSRQLIDIDAREGQESLDPARLALCTEALAPLAELIATAAELAEGLAQEVVPATGGNDDAETE